MELITQYLVQIDLVMFAVVIALYVFAASIYRGSVDTATDIETNSLEEQELFIKEQKKSMIDAINTQTDKKMISELNRQLSLIKANLNNNVKSIEAIKRYANSLSINKMVLRPFIFLAIALTTSILSSQSEGALQATLMGISIAALFIGLFVIYENLKAIGYFSKIVDIEYFLEKALEKHEEIRRPKLKIVFDPASLIVKAGAESTIPLFIMGTNNSTAKNVVLRMIYDDKLQFPDEKTANLHQDFDGLLKLGKAKIKNPKYISKKSPNIVGKAGIAIYFRMVAPEVAGDYGISFCFDLILPLILI